MYDNGVYIICDLETTGLLPQKDEILEIGLLRLEGGKITDSFQTLVKPQKPIPLRIKRLTGLDDACFMESPTIDQVLPLAIDFISNFSIVGHNVRFDLDFLYTFGCHFNNPVYDTMELARILYPTAKSYSLENLCKLLNINITASHRALEDARATAQLFLNMSDRLKKYNPEFLLKLNKLLNKTNSSWRYLVNNLTKETVKILPNSKLSRHTFFLKDDYKEIHTTPKKEDTKTQKISTKTVERIIGKNGLLAKKFPNYEYRPQQFLTSFTVTKSFNEGFHLLVEAGTGTGKSFAYLIPALLWAVKNNCRILVSTHTINLQEQLWNKDIPLLQEVLDFSFSAALLKGRQNYLCLRRWLTEAEIDDISADEAMFFARILVWLAETETGDKAEISLRGEEAEFWMRICADSESCLGSRCRWFKRLCFVSKAKRRAENADITIINHSLLFANLKMENRILPSYGPLIIDEAHHLEDVAVEQLSREVSRWTVMKWLNLVDRMLLRLQKFPLYPGAENLAATVQEVKKAVAAVRKPATLFFDLLAQLVKGNALRTSSGTKFITLRIDKRCYRETDSWAAIESEYENLAVRLKNLLEHLEQLTKMLSSPEESFLALPKDFVKNSPGISDTDSPTHYLDIFENLIEELKRFFLTGNEILLDIEFVFRKQPSDYVSWAGAEINAASKTPSCFIKSAPVEVGPLLYEHLFSSHDTIVLTSATLTVDNKFDYFIKRNGLDLLPDEKLIYKKIDSPFKLDQQARLFIVKDLPEPAVESGENYYTAVSDAIKKLLEVTQGRTMALFTSHNHLSQVYQKIKPDLTEMDILPLGHNIDGGRFHLIEEFKNNSRSILMGVSSFWEGVDLPGDILKCIIIVRLPFWPPSMPVMEARLEKMAERGKNGFYNLSLPQAIIRFKQGFGRLIRTAQDRGVVVVLDRRLTEKRYGKFFIRSLPINNYLRGSIKTVTQKVDEWLAEQDVSE